MVRRANEIRSVSDLPNWFRLGNYSGAKALDSVGWYAQLVVRHQIAEGLEAAFHEDLDSWTRLLDPFRQRPIVDLRQLDFPKTMLPFLWLDKPAVALAALLHDIPADGAMGVRFANGNDLFRMVDNVDRASYEIVAKRNAKLQCLLDAADDPPITDDESVALDKLDASLEGPLAPEATICVNLMLPDSVLVDQFRLLLQRRRAAQMELGVDWPALRKPDYASWVRFGVLPYLDLAAWARETGVSIPNRVMADAIFPPGEGGEEVVRKTTSKLASDLLDERYLQTLAATVAREKAEQKLG